MGGLKDKLKGVEVGGRRKRDRVRRRSEFYAAAGPEQAGIWLPNSAESPLGLIQNAKIRIPA
jgi:hypothetical protein